MGKSSVGSMWLSDGDGAQAIHFVCSCRKLLLDISLNEVMSTDGCSQMPLPLCSDGNTCPFKHLFKGFFNNDPSLGGVRVVSIFRAKVYDGIPPCLESSKVFTFCSIVRKPDLLDFFILKAVDEWSDRDSIHRRGEWITLGCSFLGE